MKYVFNPFTGEFDAAGLYFKENGYTLELWYKGNKVQDWTVAAPTSATIVTGNPIGLLISLTYTV
jgi:hypothetical protein